MWPLMLLSPKQLEPWHCKQFLGKIWHKMFYDWKIITKDIMNEKYLINIFKNIFIFFPSHLCNKAPP